MSFTMTSRTVLWAGGLRAYSARRQESGSNPSASQTSTNEYPTGEWYGCPLSKQPSTHARRTNRSITLRLG